MKFKLSLLFCLLALLSVAAYFGVTRTVAYASAETGSQRGATYRAGFIKTQEWTRTSWIENRAATMGILPDEQTWIKIGDTRKNFITTSRGHARAPASYFIGGFEHPPVEYSEIDLNAFVRKFIESTEEEREQLVDEFMDGGFNQ